MLPQGRGQPSTPLLPLQTNTGWKGPAAQAIHLALGPTLDGNALGQSGLTGSLRSSSAKILLRQAPPPPGSSSARTSLCGSSPSLFLRPYDQPLHFLSSWCQLPREDQRVRHQRLASTLLRLLGQPVGPAPADLAGAAPAGSTRRLRAGKMEGRKRPREIGGKAFLLRLTEQAVCFFSLVLWRQS